MRKKFLVQIILATVVAAIGLTGCKSKTGGSSGSSEQPQAKPQPSAGLVTARYRTVARSPTESQVVCNFLSRVEDRKRVRRRNFDGLIRLPEPLIRQVRQRHGPIARWRIIGLT